MRIFLFSLLILLPALAFSQSATSIQQPEKGPYHRIGTYLVVSASCFGGALLTKPLVDRFPEPWRKPGTYTTITTAFAVTGIIFGVAAGQELKHLRPVADANGIGLAFRLR